MKVHAIMNPIAGGGYSSEIFPSILSQLRKFDVSHSVTEKPGDAERMAQQAVQDGVDYLYCIGGDGTLNEVIQPLAHSDTVLVPVSAGTGSDFVKTLGYRDLQWVIDTMMRDEQTEVDLGVVEQNGKKRYFVNILEVGFGAAVMKRVNSRRKVRGGASFTLSVLATLPFFRPYRVRMVSANMDRTMDVAEMVVANGRYFGGGMLAAPAASLSDGLLDVNVVRGMNSFMMLTKLRKLRDGTYVKDPAVTSFRTEKLEVSGGAPVEIDGEDYGTLPITVSVEKGSLRILRPPDEK